MRTPVAVGPCQCRLCAMRRSFGKPAAHFPCTEPHCKMCDPGRRHYPCIENSACAASWMATR